MYSIMQMGWLSPERYATREEAQAAADAANAEADEACGAEAHRLASVEMEES